MIFLRPLTKKETFLKVAGKLAETVLNRSGRIRNESGQDTLSQPEDLGARM